jgi:nucleoside-diphosphate-sugar epimerase
LEDGKSEDGNLELLILGCGFTGQRVARRFVEHGVRVLATTRDPSKLAGLGVESLALGDVPARLSRGALVLHSIPPGGPSGLLELLGDKPARLVYLSSTAVYGAATVVDETTPVDPSTGQASARIEIEHAILRGPWSSLVLRPAAIYGPGRGAHERIRRGEYNLSDAFVSRIHADDLAAHVEAALLSTITGAYPVADEEPCTSREISQFCASLLGIPVPLRGPPGKRGSANRRVDGSAIRRLLGITLYYPTYRTGIPASL